MEKMSKVLLTSKTAWSSRLCVLTWKERDTKSGRSIFQLAASAPRIDAKESGLLPTEKHLWSTPTTFDSNNITQPRKKHPGGGQVPPLNQQVMWSTPTTMDHLPQRSEEALRRQATTTRKGRTRPANLREQVDENAMRIWRTPTTMDSKEDSLKHATKLVQGKNLRSTGARIQISLADEVMVEEIMNNPELMEKYKDYEMVTRKNLPEQQEFVDYMREQTSAKELHEKTGITKTTVEHWFRRDKAGFSHPSIEDWKAIKPYLKTIKYDNVMTALHSIEWKPEMKMWRTPDAHCDRGPSSSTRMKMKLEKGMPISINDQVAHPNLMWPTPTVDAATNRTTKYKQGGTSLALAAKLYPTPKERDYKGAEGKRVVETSTGWSKIRKGTKTKYGASLNDVAEHLQMWPTPPSTERSGINPKTGTGAGLSKAAKMWPTPRAAIGMTMKLSQGMADLRHKKYLETEVA